VLLQLAAGCWAASGTGRRRGLRRPGAVSRGGSARGRRPEIPRVH